MLTKGEPATKDINFQYYVYFAGFIQPIRKHCFFTVKNARERISAEESTTFSTNSVH